MTKLETIPAEEGATLLPQKPKTAGIRRVVAAAALASFVIGVLAATAVQRTSTKPTEAAGFGEKRTARRICILCRLPPRRSTLGTHKGK